MSGHASNEMNTAAPWGGNVSPFRVSYGKLMMWFFLVSDALTFGGLLVSYGYTRYTFSGQWPIGEETFEALPFLGNGYPLAYVALMTFILIVSSVTMVLAVEAGHRMDKKGVIKWMLATIIGGFFFLASQAWEWSHFIHGTHFGSVELKDGSSAIVKGSFGEIEGFEVIQPGAHSPEKGEMITNENISSENGDLMHSFHHAAEQGHLEGSAGNLKIHLHDGTVAKVHKAKDENLELLVKEAGTQHAVSLPADPETRISEDEGAVDKYYAALTRGDVVYGANMEQNEYGPQQYGQFFFFITGFHGFHVFSGVIINIIIFLGVLKGIYHKRGHYEMVEKTGLYWHFVDLVWVFVFTFFYLV